MNKNYISIIVLIVSLFFGVLSAQETQKNFINYQGVARNASNELMVGEAMTVTISLKFGTATAPAEYEENHSITTDTNGVFSLLIGNGSSTSGNYNTLPWGSAATFVTVSMNGSEVGTTELMAVPYAISAGNITDPSADEVLYDNSTSGLTAMTTQDAIDELVTGGSVDADADPSNELQTLSFDSGTNELSLSDGNTVTIPSVGADADADPTNEIQTISFDAASNKISLTDGGEITIPSGGADADADPANELQTLSFDAGTNELSLSDGNSVTIPSGGTDADADPTNEIQDISLAGTELSISDGSTIDLATIIPSGGSDNQNLTFNETTKVLEIEEGNTVDLSSLASGGSGSSVWSKIGDDINYIDGKVGIGTTTPQTSLSIETDGSNWNLSDTEGDFRIGDATHRLKMSTSTGGAGAGNSRIRSHGGSNRLLLGSGTDDVLTIIDQKVGIGTLDPTAPLDVAGINNWNPNSTEGDFRIGNDTYRLKVGVALGGGGAGDTRIRTDGGTNRMMLGAGANDVLTITETNVGVGTITPAASLDVQGDIRSSDLAGAGQRNVMADADGNLVIGTGGFESSLWSENEGNIGYDTGNVGIGTITPGYALDVATNSTVPLNLKSSSSESFMRFENSGGYKGYAGIWTGDNDMDFGTGAGNTLGKVHLTTNATPKLTVEANGDVGIGTTEPQSKLDVNGNIRSSNLSGTGTRNVVADSEGNLVVGSVSGSSGPIVFKVEGAGFAVKNLNRGTVIEADIWENELYDTANAFNETTKRFVAPETGYYFLHAVVDQSNAVSNAFFAIKFNIMGSWLDGTHVEGDTVKTEISGIFRLSAGQEVFVQLRNYSAGEDSRLDGNGSWFEGYKIN